MCTPYTSLVAAACSDSVALDGLRIGRALRPLSLDGHVTNDKLQSTSTPTGPTYHPQPLSHHLQHTAMGLVAFLCRHIPWVRDRLLVDPKYLFRVGWEVVVDSGCCTIAEVQKRGKDFWHEFEFYFSDMVVGLVMDVIIVTLLAPTATIGRQHRTAEFTGVWVGWAGLGWAGLGWAGLGWAGSCRF